MPDSVHLCTLIEDCYVSKLSKNFEEKEHHVEFNVRKLELEKSFLALRECLGNVEMTRAETAHINSSLLLLYMELQTKGDWNTETTRHYAALLNNDFEKLYDISLQNLLKSDDDGSQIVFDLCLDKLHSKLSSEDFKKYPSLIQVYKLLLQDVENYKVKVNPFNTLPLALLLIDDHIVANRTAGLKCCIAVLNTLATGDLDKGNYHEVFYECLCKSMKDKDLEATRLTMECLLKFVTLIPRVDQETMTDNAFSTILEETQMETNLYRKVVLIKAIQQLITIHGINCVKRKKRFYATVIENIDLCVNHSIREVLLEHVLQCMETWMKHCWCTWKYASDKKLLSVLIKLLFAFVEDENVQKVQDLIVALISICEEVERNQIISGLKRSTIQSEKFSSRLEIVLKNVLNKFK